MAGTVSLHCHGNQSGGGWKGKSFYTGYAGVKWLWKTENLPVTVIML